MSHRRWQTIAFGVFLGAVLTVGAAGAQQILLDKPVKAGELNLFQELNDPNAYYYVPNKVSLATLPDGTPQFSFLRYVKNVRSGADQAEAREGQGGGIVTGLITLGVSPEQVADAVRELRRTKPGARIEGPVMFKSGRFGLESAYADGKGNNSTQVLGLGNAPILDGGKASFTIELTKEGSTKLWNAFDLVDPGIHFTFEMDLAGYRAPIRATIDADWSKIYAHRAFAAGIASTFLAAEVNAAFDELRTTDAIKITQVGGDAKMDEIVSVAYKMVQDRMFEPFGGTGTPDLATLTNAGQGQPSLLERAAQRLQEARAEVTADNADIRKQNDEIRARAEQAKGTAGKAAGAKARSASATHLASEAEAKANYLERRARYLREHPRKPRRINIFGADPAPESEPQETPEALEKQAEVARAEATRLQQEADAYIAASDSLAAASPVAAEQTKAEKEKPNLSIIATLQMRKTKQSGSFHFDMNKYLPDVAPQSFRESIGSLKELKKDPKHFAEINMDDPLFRQRELVAMVDIANAQDFGQFVNFVDVQMRKKHASGEPTTDEVRIDRNNFNKEGNNFKLMYGWNHDDDQSRWMDYEIQSTWSLVGGKTVVEPWRAASSGTIDLAPPYRRRTVMLDGDPASLQGRDVRAVTVQLFYDVAGVEQSKQVTLNVAKGQIGDKLEFLAAPNVNNYAYQMTWQLKGNKQVSSPRQTAVADVLYVDDLPTP
jgi:hypothetical protein